jgi:hypothetical protein
MEELMPGSGDFVGDYETPSQYAVSASDRKLEGPTGETGQLIS